jgi:3-oxoacyl-[acyl-carrier-protein] synthase I
MASLLVLGMGAVTAIGLTAAQSCAGVRARVGGFREATLLAPPRQPGLAASIAARSILKVGAEDWLTNLGVRAIAECLEGHDVDPSATALLLTLPDQYRQHAAVARGAPVLLRAVGARLGMVFHPASRAVEQGRAGTLAALAIARQLLEQGSVKHCVAAGVDSLVNRRDAERLSAAGRLHEQGNPQGAVPGEGAGALLLSLSGSGEHAPIAQVLGVGVDREEDSALGERHAVGQGLASALTKAVRDAACAESQISFRVSDMNGERYHAHDSMLAVNRFYRTRRERLTVWYPAMSLGDLGAAAGAVNVIVAANAIARGFAPGPFAMCEGSSDEGMRAACIVGPASLSRIPPLRFNGR